MKIVHRSDFIGNYVGESYNKTLKLLQDHVNDDIMFDESEGALCYNEQDSFGFEAMKAIQDCNKYVGI